MRSLHRAAIAVMLLTAIVAAQPTKRGLPFIEDDFPKAFEQAKTRKLPLFVEAWAPW